MRIRADPVPKHWYFICFYKILYATSSLKLTANTSTTGILGKLNL